MRRAGLLLLLCTGPLACSEEVGERPAPEAGPPVVRIAYPRAGEVVRHDQIPLWILAPDGDALAGARVWLNGEERTAALRPFGARRGDERAEALALVAPRPGENRIELRPGGADASPHSVSFRFEPREMRVRLRVLEGDRDVPARVSLRGLAGTPDPRLAPEVWREISAQRFSADERRSFLYLDAAPLELHLPRGRYEVLASRGPAYSIARAELGPEVREATLRLARVMDTRGWVSADFHVHAMPSTDSSIPLWDRVRSYRAHDVDAIVASDHHTITDFEQDLAPLRALPAGFVAIPGVESSLPGGLRGHWNFWPLARSGADARSRHGLPSHGGRRPRSVRSASALYAHFERHEADARRRRFGDFPVVVQLNHPRGIQFEPGGPVHRAHDFLNRVGYDPERPLDAEANGGLLARAGPGLPRTIDVDAIELLNRLGYPLYEEVRRDWFAWIAAGFVPTGTANSDSHWVVVTEPGFPRNWVRADGVSAQALARAVRARQLCGSTGPLLVLEPWPSDGSPLRGAPERLVVTLRAPPWMPLEEVRVFVNGALAHRAPLGGGPADPYARYEQVRRLEVPLALERDAFVVVEAGDRPERLRSPEPHAGPMGRAFPQLRVLAFSNPLLVDVGADGTIWDTASPR